MPGTRLESSRHTEENLDTWIREGTVLVENFFREDEIRPVFDEFIQL